VSLIIVVRDEDADRVIRAVNVVCPWCEAVRLPANADIAEIAEFYGYESDGDGGLREIKRNLRANERDLRDDIATCNAAEARTGWPHAIERAMAAERKLAEAEAEVERLRLIFGNPLVYEALAHYTDEHIDSDARPDDWETVFDARVEAFKLAKEATADGQ